MFKRKADTPVTLYSASLPPHLQSAVHAIASGAYDRMQSQVFDLAEGQTQEWLEAHRLPGAPGWAVDRHSVIKASDDLHNKTTAASALCFFDALSYIAQYERNRLFVGDAPSASPCKLPHYRDVAAALGLPVDVNGAVHPAVGGRVLTDGLFSGTELAVAEKSLPVTIKPATSIVDYWPQLAAPASSSLVPATQDAPVVLTQSWQGYRDEKARIEALTSDYKRADYLLTHIGLAIRQEQSRDFGLTIDAKVINAVVKSFCILFPIATPFTIHEYFAHRSAMREDREAPSFEIFNGADFLPRLFRQLAKAIEQLPDGAPKSCLEEFAKAAQPALHFETAIAIYGLCRDAKISAKRFKKGLEEIKKAGTLAGLTEDKILQLASDYQAGRLPEPGTFINALEKSHMDFQAAVVRFERSSRSRLKALAGPTST